MFKGILFICVFAAMVFLGGTTALAVEIYFEHREHQQLSRGVIYERNRMMTGRGMLDVHVLFVDVSEPFVTVGPVTSTRNLGRNDTTLRMLADAEAIAGINADFFNPGTYSVQFGPLARDGQLLAAYTQVNLEPYASGFGHATFFLDNLNNIFFEFTRTDVRLYVNGRRSPVRIGGYNTIGGASRFNLAAIVDRQTMYDTSAIVSRIPYVSHVVVENGWVTEVSNRNSAVNVPENGFVLILPEHMHHYRSGFSWGDSVELEISTTLNVDFSRIQAAVGGYGMILQNGQPVSDVGRFVSGRHPRSAIGVTRDGHLVLMAVDGRSHSVGVTHAELGEILLRYGVTDAMHFDGGGSTTMVTSDPREGYTVVNTPSDGRQRNVINALGIFDNSPISTMNRLVLEPIENRAIIGVPLAVDVFGKDIFWNRLPIGESGAVPILYADAESGFWNNGHYTPLRTGTHELKVRYGEFTANATIYAFSLGELQISPASVNLLEGERRRLRFSGTATDGTHVNIPEVTGLTVSPAYLGRFENGYFIAQRGGAGYISVAVGTVRAYIPVTVGGFPRPLNIFEPGVAFAAQPAEYVSGGTSAENILGQNILRLDYRFTRTTRTQAAYATFYPAIEIYGMPVALRMQAYSDGSGHWMRGRVRDAEGNFHNIDFARNAYFIGWETVTASLPNAPGPFALYRLYMATTESLERSNHMAMFYGLEALYPAESIAAIPQSTVFQDRLRAETGFAGFPGGNFHEFTIPAEASYSITGVSNFAVVTMTAAGGGIQSGNIDQWRNFVPNIRALNLPNVVILLDANPLTFSRRMEYELFHLALRDLRADGFLVFAVSATAAETTLTMRDGVRYINITRPETDNASIRFWSYADHVRWDD
ncbi:MAG: phosphodiester glycosidase family protein [Defluviitaleaceae bacterium]|nr:phosphodiester glycosidase family protein [Defluviitaleaceae bacterium]